MLQIWQELLILLQYVRVGVNDMGYYIIRLYIGGNYIGISSDNKDIGGISIAKLVLCI